MAHLKMAQSVAAVFYLPHLIARELGAFRDEGLTVEFVTSFGQQWALLVPYFPDWTRASLAGVVGAYQPLGIWPRDPLIPRADWEHYNAIYEATGSASLSVRYDDYVDTSLAEKAMASL